jgi:hypothetical protein
MVLVGTPVVYVVYKEATGQADIAASVRAALAELERTCSPPEGPARYPRRCSALRPAPDRKEWAFLPINGANVHLEA